MSMYNFRLTVLPKISVSSIEKIKYSNFSFSYRFRLPLVIFRCRSGGKPRNRICDFTFECLGPQTPPRPEQVAIDNRKDSLPRAELAVRVNRLCRRSSSTVAETIAHLFERIPFLLLSVRKFVSKAIERRTTTKRRPGPRAEVPLISVASGRGMRRTHTAASTCTRTDRWTRRGGEMHTERPRRSPTVRCCYVQ